MLEIINVLKNGGNIEPGTFEKLISIGVFPMHLNLYIKIYDKYKFYYKLYVEENKKPSHTLAITHTSDGFSISEMTVKRAIKLLEHIT